MPEENLIFSKDASKEFAEWVASVTYKLLKRPVIAVPVILYNLWVHSYALSHIDEFDSWLDSIPFYHLVEKFLGLLGGG